jgi:hypothetical protein
VLPLPTSHSRRTACSAASPPLPKERHSSVSHTALRRGLSRHLRPLPRRGASVDFAGCVARSPKTPQRSEDHRASHPCDWSPRFRKSAGYSSQTQYLHHQANKNPRSHPRRCGSKTPRPKPQDSTQQPRPKPGLPDAPASWIVVPHLPSTEVPRIPLPKLWAPSSPPKWLRCALALPAFHPAETELARGGPVVRCARKLSSLRRPAIMPYRVRFSRQRPFPKTRSSW